MHFRPPQIDTDNGRSGCQGRGYGIPLYSAARGSVYEEISGTPTCAESTSASSDAEEKRRPLKSPCSPERVAATRMAFSTSSFVSTVFPAITPDAVLGF